MRERVVIVGAGVIGLTTAWFLGRAGFSVRVVDRRKPSGGHCALGSAGMIVPSHFTPLAAPGMLRQGIRWMFRRDSPFSVRPRPSVPMARWGLKFARSCREDLMEANRLVLRDLGLRSRRWYDELDDLWGLGLQRKGLLMLCKSARGMKEETETAGKARQLDIAADILDPHELSRLDSETRHDVLGGVHYPDDAWLDPGRYMSALTRACESVGVTFLWESSVQGFFGADQTTNCVIVNGRNLTTDKIVIAGGSWSPHLAKQLGVSLPVQPGKGYSLTVSGSNVRPRVSAILHEARVAVTPLDGAVRFGGTMEIGGSPGNIDEERLKGMVDSISGYYPDFDARTCAEVPRWSGLRPCSPDGLPYIGFHKRFKNILFATGHGMLGLSLAPVTGEIIADLASGEKCAHLNALNPARFG